MAENVMELADMCEKFLKAARDKGYSLDDIEIVFDTVLTGAFERAAKDAE